MGEPLGGGSYPSQCPSPYPSPYPGRSRQTSNFRVGPHPSPYPSQFSESAAVAAWYDRSEGIGCRVGYDSERRGGSRLAARGGRGGATRGARSRAHICVGIRVRVRVQGRTGNRLIRVSLTHSSESVRILHIGVRAQGRTRYNKNNAAEGKQGHSRRRPALGRPGTGRSRGGHGSSRGRRSRRSGGHEEVTHRNIGHEVTRMVSVTRMWPVTSQPVTRLTMVTRVMPGEGGFGALQRVALALRPLRSRRGGRAC